MSDRVRTGEILAVIGAVGLTVLLLFGTWFTWEVGPVLGGVGAKHLGWFALAVAILAAIAGLVAVARVLTANTTERPMLQIPVAYAAALLALIVLLIRMILFTPAVVVHPKPDHILPLLPTTARVDTSIATGGWLGLLALLLLVVGTWIAMSDDRTNAPAAIARTEALLAQSPPRPAPPATAATAPASPAVDDDAEASVDDQIGDPTEPSTPSEESA